MRDASIITSMLIVGKYCRINAWGYKFDSSFSVIGFINKVLAESISSAITDDYDIAKSLVSQRKPLPLELAERIASDIITELGV